MAARDRYDAAILKADKAFTGQLPEEAEKGYLEAQLILPEESYPGTQLQKVAALRLKLLSEKAGQLVTEGDQALAEERFDEAATKYREASRLMPADERIREKLQASDRLRQEKESALRDAEARNREYNRLITLGDRAFDGKQYTQAGGNYRDALQIKPDQEYPTIRIQRIDSILQKQETDNQYRSLLLAADAAFRIRDWVPAKENYSQALSLKPGEVYPLKQIRAIDEILERQAPKPQTEVISRGSTTESEKIATPAVQTGPTPRKYNDETEALYASIITTADQYFTGKVYNVSRAWYYKALEVKPGEGYPSGRISEINGIIGSMQLSQRDREFQDYIDRGDESFRNDQMAVARSWYNKALAIRPGDEYPQSQLSEIQMKINERIQGSAEKTFSGYLERGDQSLVKKDYNVARVWYQRALQLKPGDRVAGEKLEAVRKAMAGE